MVKSVVRLCSRFSRVAAEYVRVKNGEDSQRYGGGGGGRDRDWLRRRDAAPLAAPPAVGHEVTCISALGTINSNSCGSHRSTCCARRYETISCA